MTTMTSMHSHTHPDAGARARAPLALAGDDAFSEFYDQHVDFVWRNLRRVGVPSDELDDVCQEVFVTVHRRWTAFEARSAPRAWLYGILRRVASRHRRGADRRQRRHEAFAARPRYDTGESAVAGRVLALRLQQFLEQLDEDKRDVFVLAELEELSATEISQRVGVGPNTVYSRLRAARAAFETRFGPLPRQRTTLVATHHADAPTEAQRNAVWIAVVATPWATPPPPPAAAAAATASPWLLGGAGSFLAAVVVLAAAVGARAPTSPALQSAGDAVTGTQAPILARPDPVDPPVARPTATPTPATAVAAKGDHPARAPVMVSAAPRGGLPAPNNEAPPTTAGAPRRPAAGSVSPKPAQPSSTAGLLSPDELTLVQDARQALDQGKPRRALARLREHARRFDHSVLAPERNASFAEAHCAAGDADAAAPYLRRLLAAGHDATAQRIAARCP